MAKEAMQNPKIQLRLAKEIPWELIRNFAHEAGADSSYADAAEAAEVKIGAFHGEKMVGFVCAGRVRSERRRILLAPAFYVEKAYRGKGIGTRLLHKLAVEAKKRRLGGAQIYNMLPAMRAMFEKEAERLASKGQKNPFSRFYIDWKDGVSGKIWLKRRSVIRHYK